MPQQLTTPLLLVLMVAAFYFLMIRPQQKRARAQRETLSALTPGTRVLLANGFYATVVEVQDTVVEVELAPGLSSFVVKQAVVQVVPAGSDPAALEPDRVEPDTLEPDPLEPGLDADGDERRSPGTPRTDS
ncbi:preprotein translocase subunit YajC [Auraticoccus sp. F435]|uniref:Preprotein translocase subunit YajC n=1 Tax=Auraticoccus cholistanensis TaxID=2656650 RepID=A0A6A9UWB2_9ACTN|nr:preprotein translocase subunit YajC [Auraticoccus cholistanensis]MVA75955.1 preprotein translocase subunit YajC [Auraticoccus cholistanensis]